jgi:hypothetical protein
LRQRLADAADREGLVLVAAAIGKQLQRIGHLVIDLENIAVGVGEVIAALVDVVGGTHDRDAVFDQMGVGVAQRGVAADLEGDVSEPDLSALRTRRGASVGEGCCAMSSVWKFSPKVIKTPP